MKYTEKLGLPIWDNPSSDTFNIEDFNRANSCIEDFSLNIEDRLKFSTFVMHEPGTVEENTKQLQQYLDIAKNNNINITIKFMNGTYDLNTCTIYSNTTILLSAGTVLNHINTKFYNPENNTEVYVPILFFNAKPFDEQDSKITEYNGNSNITIKGGYINSLSALCLCHGQNINIEKVKFNNITGGHYIQIGGCKNVTIKDCEFKGQKAQDENRNYVEYIQIDWLVSGGQPYWVTTSPIFDSTINNGITIDNCKFSPGEGDYNNLYTCIGTHSSDNGKRNKNIIIKNCEFNSYSYAGVTLRWMDNITIDNNTFNNTTSADNILITNSTNVTVKSNNRVSGGKRAIYCTSSNNVFIDGILCDNLNSEGEQFFFGENDNVKMNNIIVRDSVCNKHMVGVRGCTNMEFLSNKEFNCTASNDLFYYIYNKDGVTMNKHIKIKDTITSFSNILKVKNGTMDSKELISDISDVEEVLFEGEVKEGSIVLSKDINKFTDLKINIMFYGVIQKDLRFINGRCIFREWNASDALDNLDILFNELDLKLIDNITINIMTNNMIKLVSADMTLTSMTSVCSIKKITGRRVKF